MHLLSSEPTRAKQMAQRPPASAIASHLRRLSISTFVLICGTLAIALPTLYDIATITWSTEQGGHGLLVLVTGLWLIYNQSQGACANGRLGEVRYIVLFLILLVPVYFVSRISGILEVESFAAYLLILTAVYALFGRQFMAQMTFPFAYLAFAFPPPDTVVYALTLPLKVSISELSIFLLSEIGYPIGGQGVMIQIGPYELLVAAACAGLNSILTLSALTVFYLYLRHANNWRLLLVLSLLVIPVALFANFIRVLLLLLVTYHFGELAAQSYLHSIAGLLMFSVALVTIVVIDRIVSPKLANTPLQSRADG